MSLNLPSEDKQLYQLLLDEAEGRDLHIVGGYVRDLLLDSPTVDLDFMIERDLKGFLESVVKRLGSEKIVATPSHSRFFTAKLNLSPTFLGQSTIDFSEARKERYPTPASRPEVSEGTVKEDILRRDFTINSIAILKDDFLDPTNGRGDLERKLIRVHHEKSFVDDPIRLVRAIRFKNRLRFNLESETAKFFEASKRQNFLSLVSPRRRFEELRKVFSEKNSVEILKELESSGLLQVLCPAILAAKIDSLTESDAFETGLLKIVDTGSSGWKEYVDSLALPRADSKRLKS